jgi:hypothetical protein
MDAFWWNVLGAVAISGLSVSLVNIQRAILLGMGIAFLVTCCIFIVSLSNLSHLNGWDFIKDLIFISGNIIVFILLLGFYIVYCLIKNNDYISSGDMPDSWYLFSYFVVGVTALNIVATIAYMKDITSGIYHALSMLLTTILLGFIIIETIICSYFRTDGFTNP